MPIFKVDHFQWILLGSFIFSSQIVLADCEATLLRPILNIKMKLGSEKTVVVTYAEAEGRQTETTYLISNRGLEKYRTMFGDRYTDIYRLRSERVLDAGTGDGAFIFDLQAKGLRQVYGVDIVLNESQLNQPLFFQKADIRQTSYPNEFFDRIFSSLSIFWHEQQSYPFMFDALKEIHRILKPGGVFHIYPRPMSDEFDLALSRNPELIPLTDPSTKKILTLQKRDLKK